MEKVRKNDTSKTPSNMPRCHIAAKKLLHVVQKWKRRRMVDGAVFVGQITALKTSVEVRRSVDYPNLEYSRLSSVPSCKFWANSFIKVKLSRYRPEQALGGGGDSVG
jgi:hypothetical protein